MFTIEARFYIVIINYSKADTLCITYTKHKEIYINSHRQTNINYINRNRGYKAFTRCVSISLLGSSILL